MNADAARAELFGDSLVCEEVRPAAFAPSELDPTARRMAIVRAENLLHALAVVEDSRVEDTDERTVSDLTLARIEAKVDLLAALVASISKVDGAADQARSLQWSALGACLAEPGPGPGPGPDQPPAAGTRGTFRIQPSDWLPDTLQLPATVLASVPDGPDRGLWLRFEPVSAALTAALERHLFRVHRRAIAESRRGHRPPA